MRYPNLVSAMQPLALPQTEGYAAALRALQAPRLHSIAHQCVRIRSEWVQPVHRGLAGNLSYGSGARRASGKMYREPRLQFLVRDLRQRRQVTDGQDAYCTIQMILAGRL